MGVLANYAPQDVFGYFETICGIPRGSGNTGAIADYLVSFAKEHGLESYRDAANNVLIRKKASPGYEKADIVILQGHHDMVCEKVDGLEFDFTKQGVVPVVDGDWIRAQGTSLGGDNGIAVAMMLAVLADDTLPHPAIEALITADEEIGMLGAFAFDCRQLKGHKLINLDSEYEGVIMCSCAGGAYAFSRLPVKREALTAQMVDIQIKGLRSGHSGVEIDKGRANSNILMARLLHALADKAAYRLVMLEGGTRETAIAAASSARIAVAAGEVETVRAAIVELGNTFRMEYATAEPEMQMEASLAGEATADALTAESTRAVHALLVSLPDGVQVMSVDMPGLVQTSLNLGVLTLKENELYIADSVRSSITSQREWILAKVAAITELAGGKTEIAGRYPGLVYNPNSALKNTIISAYKALMGKEPSVEAVHAGIECGLFSESIPNLDCVSIGPDMADVHTTREHLSISSTQRTYELLKAVLAASK